MASDPIDAPGLVALLAGKYALAGLLTLAAFALGRRVTRGTRFHSAAESFAFSAAIGLGTISLALFALGAARLLRTGPSLLVLAGALAVGRREIAGAARGAAERFRARSPAGRRRLLLGSAGVLALALPLVLLPLYPPTQWDATGYHLPYAKGNVEEGRLAFNPFLRYPTFPQLNEMLFTLSLLLGGDLLAQLVEFLMLVILVLGCWSFGARHASARVGLWGAALLLGNSQVIWLGTIAYVDLGLAMFAALGVFAYWNARRTGETPWLLLSAALLGMGAGTKYLGVVPAGLVGLVALADAVRARRWRPLLAFAGVFALVASPWYVRNALVSGNPVFPFLPEVFGYGLWRAEDLRWLADDVIAKRGVGRGVSSLLSLPWHLVAHQSLFDAEERISPLFGAALPVMLLAATRIPPFGLLYAVGVGYLVFWFSSAQILRYLVPALPIFAVAMAAALDRVLARARARWAWLGSGAFALVLAALFAAPGWGYAIGTLREWGPPPASAAGRERFITRLRPSYPAYAYLNTTRGKSYAVYAYKEQCMTYFADGVFMGDFFGPARYAGADSLWEDGEGLYQSIRSLGATHLLVSSWYGKVTIPPDDAFHRRFRLVWGRANTALFEISDPPRERILGVDRIENGGLERVVGGEPEGWVATGDTKVDVSGAQSSGGAVAVLCRGGRATLLQGVGVSPGEACFLRCRARGEGRPARAALIVDWFGEDGKPLGREVEMSVVGTTWRGYRMLVTAPAAAAYANVGAAPDTSGAVWFDDLFFSGLTYQ